jgi:hypothetical protein
MIGERRERRERFLDQPGEVALLVVRGEEVGESLQTLAGPRRGRAVGHEASLRRPTTLVNEWAFAPSIGSSS